MLAPFCNLCERLEREAFRGYWMRARSQGGTIGKPGEEVWAWVWTQEGSSETQRKGIMWSKLCFLKITQTAVWREKKLQRSKAQDRKTCQWLSQTSRRVGRAWAQGAEAVGVEGRSKLNCIWQHPDADNEERAWGQSCLSNSDFLRIFQAIYHL